TRVVRSAAGQNRTLRNRCAPRRSSSTPLALSSRGLIPTRSYNTRPRRSCHHERKTTRLPGGVRAPAAGAAPPGAQTGGTQPMTRGLGATAAVDVEAPADAVWAALIDPQTIKRYLLDTEVVSDWQPGSPIVWKGVYEGTPFQDKGVILEIDPGRRLSYSHFSPLTGKPDLPEHYHPATPALTPPPP